MQIFYSANFQPIIGFSSEAEMRDWVARADLNVTTPPSPEQNVDPAADATAGTMEQVEIHLNEMAELLGDQVVTMHRGSSNEQYLPKSAVDLFVKQMVKSMVGINQYEIQQTQKSVASIKEELFRASFERESWKARYLALKKQVNSAAGETLRQEPPATQAPTPAPTPAAKLLTPFSPEALRMCDVQQMPSTPGEAHYRFEPNPGYVAEMVINGELIGQVGAGATLTVKVKATG